MRTYLRISLSETVSLTSVEIFTTAKLKTKEKHRDKTLENMKHQNTIKIINFMFWKLCGFSLRCVWIFEEKRFDAVKSIFCQNYWNNVNRPKSSFSNSRSPASKTFSKEKITLGIFVQIYFVLNFCLGCRNRDRNRIVRLIVRQPIWWCR